MEEKVDTNTVASLFSLHYVECVEKKFIIPMLT